MKKNIDKIVLAVVFILVLTGVIWARIDEASFRKTYVNEDHLIEWLTVLALLGSSALCFFRIYKLKATKSWPYLLITFIFGCMFLFGVGEEISWGQRIFKFTSSDFFQTYNTQREVNLHNLIVRGIKINILIFSQFLSIMVVIYFIVLPILYRKYATLKIWIDRFAIPLPTWFHLGCYLLLFLLSEATGSDKRFELLEFGGSWIFFMMIFKPLNKENFKFL